MSASSLQWHYAKPKVIGDYRLERSIGKGTFAHVYLARNLITDSNVAVKIVDKNKIDPENLRKTYRELSIMQQLIHPNVIRLYQVIETDLLLCLVTEYASRGELYTHLKSTGKLTEADARVKFQQMTAAVAYCHASGICHRDLKAENILLDANMNIKLADFGFSNFYTSGETLKTCCGSPPYASPELFQGLEYDGFKTDVWSLGVLLYILVTGGFPFPGSSYENLRLAVLRCSISIPYFVSIECNDLIRRMLVADPKRRYSIQEVVKHRWFTAEIEDDTAMLVRSSLNGKAEPELPEPIQESVVLLLQQKGFTLEQIVESVTNRRFDGVFAAYQLLHDRLKRRASQTVTRAVCMAMDTRVTTLRNNVDDELSNSSRLSVTDGQPVNPAPRRGSITTGIVSPECHSDPVSTTQISVADVLVLNRSSPPGNSDQEEEEEDQNMSGDGEEEENESHDSASSTSDDEPPYEPPPNVLKRYLGQRRHTLGYPLAEAQVPTTTAFGMNDSNDGIAGPYPFQQLTTLVGQEQSHLLRQPANANLLLSNFPAHNAMLSLHPSQQFPQFNPLLQFGMPSCGSDRLVPPSLSARRASDSSRLLKHRFVDGPRLSSHDILRLSSNTSSITGGFVPPAEGVAIHPNVVCEDEDLKRYLSTRNSAKRHTIHAAQPLNQTVSPTRVSEIQRLSNHHSSHRHHHSQPYPARRCSDGSGGSLLGTSGGSQLPPSVLAHLEKLHNQALGHCEEPVGFGSGSLRTLHQEFSQLLSSSELNHQLQMMQLQSSSSQVPGGTGSTAAEKLLLVQSRSSPPTQNLHVISEVDDSLHSTGCGSFLSDGKQGQEHNMVNSDWIRAVDGSDSTGGSVINDRPIINITDESGTLLSSQQPSPNPSRYNGPVTSSIPYDCSNVHRPFMNGGSYMEASGLSQFDSPQLMSASLPFQSAPMALAQSPPYSSPVASFYEQGAQRILDRNAFVDFNGFQQPVDFNRLNEIYMQTIAAQSQLPGLQQGGDTYPADHQRIHLDQSPFGGDSNTRMEETSEDCSDEDQIFRTSLNLIGLENKVRRVVEQLHLSFIELSTAEDVMPKSFSMRNQQRKLRLNTDDGSTGVNVILAPEFTQGNSGVRMMGTTVNFQHVCGSRERYRKVCSDLIACLSAM